MRPSLVRAVFAAAVVALPVQMVVDRALSEPYPGLFQPGFSGVFQQGDVATAREPEATVRYADGRDEVVPWQALLPEGTAVLPLAVLRRLTLTPGVADDPETATFLRGRISDRRPGGDPEVLTVAWRRVAYPLDGGPSRVLAVEETVRIDVSTP